jgi:CRISPR-associated protein Cmr2
MTIYTAITFAPVQGFIEKSRKLRDLYGSSFILSYLADHLCKEIREYLCDDSNPPSNKDPIVSPAIINTTQGTPNQIIIKIEKEFADRKEKETFEKAFVTTIKTKFDRAWEKIIDGCRTWIEKNIRQENGQPFEYLWQRNWDLWTSHAWEFFWATGNTITEAREALNEKKRSRNWIGINWTGESSTLSGADGIAWYGMEIGSPKEVSRSAIDTKIQTFYQQFSKKVDESIISEREQLSIPEVIKRLITLEKVAVKHIGISADELPKSFKDLNRHKEDDSSPEEQEEFTDPIRDDKKDPRSSGWFQGDGDKAGDFLKKLAGTPQEESTIHTFSLKMRQWGENLDSKLPTSKRYLITKDGDRKETNITDYDGRIIYAGGDDLLGVLYRNPPNPILTGYDCIKWFYEFESDRQDTIWKKHQQPISISIGFVWAAPKVPQREVLQHCRDAEKSAKSNGKDRLAIRILFNSGNYLEWVCPWWFLNVLEDYRDRNKNTGNKANWSHIYEDVAYLESNHAFTQKIDLKHPDLESSQQLEKHIKLALSLFEIYFPNKYEIFKNPNLWWEHYIDNVARTGILSASKNELIESLKEENDSEIEIKRKLNKWVIENLNNWVINLAKVGFHLCRQRSQN